MLFDVDGFKVIVPTYHVLGEDYVERENVKEESG